mmetsp:Transcript_12919/g.30068  ORF Transcript_12919/g.30068 Transcript_12919/m.30068 type:complete len:245 (+) Transcript_12919:1460-2194(+)
MVQESSMGLSLPLDLMGKRNVSCHCGVKVLYCTVLEYFLPLSSGLPIWIDTYASHLPRKPSIFGRLTACSRCTNSLAMSLYRRCCPWITRCTSRMSRDAFLRFICWYTASIWGNLRATILSAALSSLKSMHHVEAMAVARRLGLSVVSTFSPKHMLTDVSVICQLKMRSVTLFLPTHCHIGRFSLCPNLLFRLPVRGCTESVITVFGAMRTPLSSFSSSVISSTLSSTQPECRKNMLSPSSPSR